MIRHHPAADILVDYARGALDSGASLVVACHLDVCEPCRREAHLWEGVGGALLATAAPAPLSGDVRAALLARLDEPGTTPMRLRDKLPAYMKRYAVPGPLKRENLLSRRWVAPGIWFAPVEGDWRTSRRSYLVFAERGAVMPEHGHGGREFTFVLYGSFSDAKGTFGMGDFAEADERTQHAPAMTGESDCLCLISSETPMSPAAWPARFVQRLFGMPY